MERKSARSRLAFEDDSVDFHESVLVIKVTGGLMSPFITHAFTIIHVRSLPIQYTDH